MDVHEADEWSNRYVLYRLLQPGTLIRSLLFMRSPRERAHKTKTSILHNIASASYAFTARKGGSRGVLDCEATSHGLDTLDPNRHGGLCWLHGRLGCLWSWFVSAVRFEALKFRPHTGASTEE